MWLVLGRQPESASRAPHIPERQTPITSLWPTSLTTCKPGPCLPLWLSPTQLPSALGERGTGLQPPPPAPAMTAPGSDLTTWKILPSQRISFPFTSGNWTVRTFSERAMFIFPRFKGTDIGNGLRLVLYSSRGQNKHYSLNKEKRTCRERRSRTVVSILCREVFNRNRWQRLSRAKPSVL